MSRFTGHLGLEPLEDENGLPILTDDGRTQWKALAPPLIYDVGELGSGEEITFPPGATTDLGSIPRPAWSLGFSPDGPGVKIFVIHDFLYHTGGTCEFEGTTYRTRETPYTRKEADDILREGLKILNVGSIRRALIWSAVRLGGSSGWKSLRA